MLTHPGYDFVRQRYPIGQIVRYYRNVAELWVATATAALAETFVRISIHVSHRVKRRARRDD